MQCFKYAAPAQLEEAFALLAQHEDVSILAGGTDLLGLMKRGVHTPELLLSLSRIAEIRDIASESNGSLRIGGMARLGELQRHPLLQSYPPLVQAIRRTATPQIRNLATIGGNLCQRPRCWYYRHPDFPCLRKHGESCFAMGGEDRYHAVVGGDRCFFVHPSDLAPALMALDASVALQSSGNEQRMSLADFFVGPGEDMFQETTLKPGELLTHIHLPPPSENVRGVFLKVAERKATDFALVNVAVCLGFEEEQIRHARIVMGGVAPVPWQLSEVEEHLVGQPLTQGQIEQACELVLADAKPLRQNSYKVGIARGLLWKALKIL